jgi:hypothetical protein
MTDHTVVELLPNEGIPSIDDPTFSDSFEGESDEEVSSWRLTSLRGPTARSRECSPTTSTCR